MNTIISSLTLNSFQIIEIPPHETVEIDTYNSEFYLLSNSILEQTKYNFKNSTKSKDIIPQANKYYSFSDAIISVTNYGDEVVIIKGWNLEKGLCTTDSFFLNYSNNMYMKIYGKNACLFSPLSFNSSAIKFSAYAGQTHKIYTKANENPIFLEYFYTDLPFFVQISNPTTSYIGTAFETIGIDKNISNKCGLTSFSFNLHNNTFNENLFKCKCSSFAISPFSIVLFTILQFAIIGFIIFLLESGNIISIRSYFSAYTIVGQPPTHDNENILDDIQHDVANIDV